MTTLTFPAGFRWGTATSAYQIEGAVDQDGRTESIWDVFCRVPGADREQRRRDGGRATTTTATHEDVAQLAELGMDTYRFSVSWSRVLRPDGSSEPGRPRLLHAGWSTSCWPSASRRG